MDYTWGWCDGGSIITDQGSHYVPTGVTIKSQPGQPDPSHGERGGGGGGTL